MTPAVQQWVGHYINNMHFAVVPLEPRTKKCRLDDWPTRHFGIDDFVANNNVGIRSIDGLVVLDDDFPDSADACMDAFLPPTGAVYGRRRISNELR
jgi:hypothetical protein